MLLIRQMKESHRLCRHSVSYSHQSRAALPSVLCFPDKTLISKSERVVVKAFRKDPVLTPSVPSGADQRRPARRAEVPAGA